MRAYFADRGELGVYAGTAQTNLSATNQNLEQMVEALEAAHAAAEAALVEARRRVRLNERQGE